MDIFERNQPRRLALAEAIKKAEYALQETEEYYNLEILKKQQKMLPNNQGEGTYRVLINNQTYTYFFDTNVWQISQKDKDARLIILIDKTSSTDYNYQEKVDPIGYALDLESRGQI